MKPFDRFALLTGLLALAASLTLYACQGASASIDDRHESKKITYAIPTPTPVEIFWIDSAGNLGLRGVEAVVPGAPLPEGDPRAGKLPKGCRESATVNGDGVLTVCMSPTVGRVLAEKLGLTWTSGTSEEP